MQLAYSAITEVKQVKPKKRVPMYEDPVFMAELRRSFIAGHNRKIKSKPNYKNL